MCVEAIIAVVQKEPEGLWNFRWVEKCKLKLPCQLRYASNGRSTASWQRHWLSCLSSHQEVHLLNLTWDVFQVHSSVVVCLSLTCLSTEEGRTIEIQCHVGAPEAVPSFKKKHPVRVDSQRMRRGVPAVRLRFYRHFDR